MEKPDLFEYKKKLVGLSEIEKKLRDLYLRKIALGELQGPTTGYPSIDKPWLKYYTEEQILAPKPNMSAYDYLRVLNNNNLNNIALEDPERGEKISYREFFSIVNSISKSLYSFGVREKEIITVVLPPLFEEVYLLYAADQIGACVNFVCPADAMDEIESNMKLLNSNKLIISDNLLSQENNFINNSNYNVINISLNGDYRNQGENITSWQEFEKMGENVEFPMYIRDPEETLFIAKTGGSTGKPKNVMLSDKSFNLQVHQHLNSPLNYSSGDRWLRVWPMFSASSAVDSVHLPLCFGMTQVIVSEFDINKIDEMILKYRPSHIILISSCLDILLKSELLKDQDLSFIKSIGIGGEKVTPETEEKAKEFMIKHNISSCMTYGYGMSENGSGATSRFNEATSTVGGMGVPQVNTTVGIFIKDSDEELQYNKEGEICVNSETLMNGYYNDPVETNKVLKKHADGTVWLHTLDRGYIAKNGQVFPRGRYKRMIFLFDGNKVYPDDISELLETLDVIDRAVIVTEPDPIHENSIVPCAFITLNHEISEEELRQQVEEVIKKYAASFVKLNNIYICSAIPKTSIGKVDLQGLEAEARSRAVKKRNKIKDQ